MRGQKNIETRLKCYNTILSTYITSLCWAPTYLTSWMRFRIEELPVTQPVRKVLHIHGTRKFYYRHNSSAQPAPTLSQINPVHALQFHSFNIHFNIILPPALRFFKWSFLFSLPHQNTIGISLSPHVLHFLPTLSSSTAYGPHSTKPLRMPIFSCLLPLLPLC